MNWLDTQTKELLQKVRDEKLAPPKIPGFALVLLREGQDRERLVGAVVEINKCNRFEAAALVRQPLPATINRDLTEDDALWGQFELICCNAISIFVRTEVLMQNDKDYLGPLFAKVLESPEFVPTVVDITDIPSTEPGEKFIEQFLGEKPVNRIFPATVIMPFKKARIMEHWATRIGATLKIESGA